MTENPVTRRAVLGGLTGIAAAGLTGVGVASADDLTTTVAAPEIIGCAGWGARRPTSPVDIVGHRPSKIIVHHTVTANTSDRSKAQAKRHARQVQNIHMNSNGWRDTGYLFLVSRGGFITEGRHRSLEMLRGGRRFVEGAHTSGHNTTGFGVALEGSYHLSAPVPDRQWRALVHLCAFACQKYGIAPRKIYGHRDFGATACPGDRMYRRLADLREAVRRRL
ncbi:N-acetylmuramoyl-L-alanine amidase [Stackebrandtia albiflava]|uniref:N-acetylmuramoyl-L-alanine amidase n=1 Tax=Stackebrandtia albiflava TaxID=406432 RepID=A0A562V1J2_9ACTN|nr:peptidoglycan recognition family protein [Stackebrandtia albiflava]TWJ11667.1 N-acetylmuramoyl-L-alanine amidase [Stackebrandtia albiflava]